MDFNRCSKSSQDSKPTVIEHGRKFRIENSKKEIINEIKVDGCLITEGKRCDYLFEIGKNCRCAIYVELKGKDVNYACEQLVETIKALKSRHEKITKICHIVASRIPRANVSVQNLKAEMMRKHKILLYVSTQEVVVDIEQKPYIKNR